MQSSLQYFSLVLICQNSECVLSTAVIPLPGMSTTETPVLAHKYTCKDIPYSSVYSPETLQITNDHDEGKVSYKKEHTDDAMCL